MATTLSGMMYRMRLLLTSGGITNRSIADALAGLLEKPKSEAKVVIITTAANVERGNKDWFAEQFTDFYRYDFSWVDFVDISAPGVDWQSALTLADIVLVGGGNTFHLLDQVRSTGFDVWLKENDASKVYMGISAGSILATPSIAVASVDNGDENLSGLTNLRGLTLVGFEVSPHTPEDVSHESNRAYRATIHNDLYGIDNQTAIKVVGSDMEIVTEGEWVKY